MSSHVKCNVAAARAVAEPNASLGARLDARGLGLLRLLAAGLTTLLPPVPMRSPPREGGATGLGVACTAAACMAA